MPNEAPHYEPLLHVILYQPEIPYNAGNVGRTCVAIGAKLWMVRPLGFRVDDYYLRRAGMDYWKKLEWEVADDWPSLVARLPERRPWLFTKHAERPFHDALFEPGDVLVFGRESSGLPDSLRGEYPDRTLRIPVRAEARSLNLSNSVAVALFEALGQWRREGRQIPDQELFP